MTPHDDLAEDERIIEGATAGPWEPFKISGATGERGIKGPGHWIDCGVCVAFAEADQSFIARSRTRWPALVAEVRELREALAVTLEELRGAGIRYEYGERLLARHEEGA